jgi:DEAD/DEAH box helicase domain-containing protein
MSNIQALISYWRNSEFFKNVARWERISPTPSKTLPFPDDLNPVLKESLINQGIHDMYSHQICAWDQINSGKNVVISTGTASGKTIC